MLLLSIQIGQIEPGRYYEGIELGNYSPRQNQKLR